MLKFNKLDLIPGAKKVETFITTYSIVFSLLVMYQALFGGFALKNPPKRLVKLMEHDITKILTLTAIAFTATKDIEISLISVMCFLLIIYFSRTPEERKKAKGIIS
jgi:hypothetical protein